MLPSGTISFNRERSELMQTPASLVFEPLSAFTQFLPGARGAVASLFWENSGKPLPG